MFLVSRGFDEEINIKCYIDASFQMNQDDSYFYSHDIFIMNGNRNDWGFSEHSIINYEIHNIIKVHYNLKDNTRNYLN